MLKPYHKAELTFDIVSEIGQNGKNSRTFIIDDHQLNARIVAKRLEKASLNSPDEFFEEASALYASAHPNVVQIHYACFDSDYVYVAMPYYSNGSLKEVITGKHLTTREVIVLSSQFLAGLHNIHSKGLIHFDIKPDNILLSGRNEALLSDFGLAKQTDLRGIAGQDRFYGPMMPPEAFDKDHFDRRFDIYQVGLTLYRMCNGNEHFRAQVMKYQGASGFDRSTFKFDVQNGRFPDRKLFNHHVPVALRNVIKTCLEPDPTRRYQSALDVANAIAGIDGDSLDWRLVNHPDKMTWTRNTNGTESVITLNGDGSCQGTTCGKSGRPRKISDACRAKISEYDLRRLLANL